MSTRAKFYYINLHVKELILYHCEYLIYKSSESLVDESWMQTTEYIERMSKHRIFWRARAIAIRHSFFSPNLLLSDLIHLIFIFMLIMIFLFSLCFYLTVLSVIIISSSSLSVYTDFLFLNSKKANIIVVGTFCFHTESNHKIIILFYFSKENIYVRKRSWAIPQNFIL